MAPTSNVAALRVRQQRVAIGAYRLIWGKSLYRSMQYSHYHPILAAPVLTTSRIVI